MTIAYRTRTAVVGSTSLSPTLPTSLADGEAVVIFVSTKPDTATINVPAGWTLLADVAGGGGTTGVGVGPTRQAALFREKDASWSTMPTISVTSGNSSVANTFVFTKGASTTWGTAAATGTWGAAAATTNASTTLGSNPGITAGDAVLVNYSNMATGVTWSAQSVSATGLTVGAASDAFAAGTSTGNDILAEFFWASITAGTASAAPVTAATVSAAGRGTVSLVRLREVAAVPVQYAASGTVDATSATTGTAAARLAGSGTVAGTSATTGTATARLAASGTTAAASASTGAAVRTSPASGTVAATSDTTGVATALLPAAGTTAATSGTTGSASVIGATQQLSASGTVDATSATIGAATAALVAAGITVAQATATGSASALLDTSGSVEAVSGTSGAADVIVAVVEPPTPQRRIVSAVLTIPTLAADLEVPGSIAATLTAAGTLRADLTIPEARGVLT